MLASWESLKKHVALHLKLYITSPEASPFWQSSLLVIAYVIMCPVINSNDSRVLAMSHNLSIKGTHFPSGPFVAC